MAHLAAMAREKGIPAGLPYLTGFVMHCAVNALSQGATVPLLNGDDRTKA